MLSGLLVYTEKDAVRNRRFIDWLLEEAEKLEIKLAFQFREDIYIGIESGGPFARLKNGEPLQADFAIVRCIDSIFTRQLELLGIKTFNSSIVAELCNDKAKTHQTLATLGIPMSDTQYLSDEQMPTLANPFVVKHRNGRGGAEVFLVEQNDQYKLAPNQIAQKLVTRGKDVRVFVIGREIIGAVCRSSESDFRANYSLGGDIHLHDLSAMELKIVDRLVNTFEFGFVGIDFVYDLEGNPLLNEIEDVVGSRTLSKLTDINTANLYLSFIKNTFREDN